MSLCEYCGYPMGSVHGCSGRLRASECKAFGHTFNRPECDYDNDIHCLRCGCRRITTRDREGRIVRRDYTYGSVAEGRTSSVMRKVERIHQSLDGPA